MTPESTYKVHTGVWTNWSRGQILGTTLTLSQNDANLLIAFVSFWVSLVGTRAWKIICLIIHFQSSSGAPHDALHHQRQAIFRNASDAVDAFTMLFNLLWAWYRIATRPLRRTLPFLVLAGLWFLGWTTAAGFSSQVSSSVGNEVLVDSPSCGTILTALDSNFSDVETALIPSLRRQAQTSASYVEQCYSSSASKGPLDCGTFVQKSIPAASILTNAHCPFTNASICRSNDSNILIDTGYLSSHTDFGLNAPESERWYYRRVLSCAPIVTEGYTTRFNLSADRSVTRYWYGSGPTTLGNWTYQYSNDGLWEAKSSGLSFSSSHYVIGLERAWFINGSLYEDESDFLPIPSLLRRDADVILFFLSANQIFFATTTNDPWFKASTPAGNTSRVLAGEGSLEMYYQDEPASPLACTNQAQLCTSSMNCTLLLGTNDVWEAGVELFQSQSPAAYNRWNWAFNAVFSGSLTVDWVVNYMGDEAILARNSLTKFAQGPLPDDQWKLEVQHWHNTSMAITQSFFVSTATGPADNQTEKWILGPNNTEEYQLCKSQKIITTAYVSFNVLGLALIFGFGAFTILLSLLLDPAISWLCNRYGRYRYSHLEWRINETLQLQRLAHEELGVGTWSKTMCNVPVTEANEHLSTLDLSDPTHPRFVAPLPLMPVDSVLEQWEEDMSIKEVPIKRERDSRGS